LYVYLRAYHGWHQTDILQADYKDIDPVYGSLDDVDQLISELKKRDMKLMMDLVVNHTSDQVGGLQSI
jgi:glycosidase